VNKVLWNTIQLLFPQEVDARKAACAGARAGSQIPETASCNNLRRINPGGGETSVRRRENVLLDWADGEVLAQIHERPFYNDMRYRSARGSSTLYHLSLARVMASSARVITSSAPGLLF
jgi:hypothetical protein